MINSIDVLIIGAGIAGMSAARQLTDAGKSVLVLDKGRGISGRMATRRWGEAKFDHGAQFFSARTTSFQKFVQQAQQNKLIQSWQPGGIEVRYPRWMSPEGMNAIPKSLSNNITILKKKRVHLIRPVSDKWEVETTEGETFQASAIVITIPAPQAMELLENSELNLEEHPLEEIAYHPCLVVLAKLDQASGIPAPGGLKVKGPVVEWIADNYQKGISTIPAITIHADPQFSQQHLDGNLEEAASKILTAASSLIAPAKVTEWQVHRWRYSLCYKRHPQPFWRAKTPQALYFGGDGFGMGNVEGAYESGRSIAIDYLGD